VQQQGLAAGVDEQGRLMLDTPAGRVAVLSGDVSLRLAS
jgi:BirA family biotin operon repressor/biotin-[acetyl-CoA-carboxylase] ligase